MRAVPASASSAALRASGKGSALRAVDKPEFTHGVPHRVVRVPAAAAKVLGLEILRAHPLHFLSHPLRRIAAARSRMRRTRPMCVQAERTASRRGARACEPAFDVLAVRGVWRPHERDHVETAGAASLQLVEPGPGIVAQRLLEMAGDDRDWVARHTVAHVRDLRTLFAVGRAAAVARRRYAGAHPPPRPGSGLDGRLRLVRARASAASGDRSRARLPARRERIRDRRCRL